MPVITTRSRESENKKLHFLQRKLQVIILRAAVGGYISPIESAISIHGQLSEGRSNLKDVLDTFPENMFLKVELF